jgi:ZIP family zinc transporter
MSTWQTIALGAVAGVTIFLGLPLGRLKGGSLGLKTFLSGLSAGILVFLLFDVLAHATEPLEEAVVDGAWGELVAVGLVYVVGLGVGLLGLPYFFRVTLHRARGASLGPGAMAVAEIGLTPDRQALRLGMTIAAGIGLHNFSEGLAIGQAASADEISLAVLLVVGFALHNATEGFGIVGPLAGAGGPTFLGTIVGTAFSSEYVFVGFLALAAGAILYVIGELFASGRRLSWILTLWGVLGGFLLGLATDLVIEAAGG